MNIQAMMAQAKKMQAEMEKAKAELASKEFVVEKQGIKIVVWGNRVVKSVEIHEALIDPDDKDIIEDLLVIAFNEAMEQIDKAQEDSQPKMPGGMGGMF